MPDNKLTFHSRNSRNDCKELKLYTTKLLRKSFVTFEIDGDNGRNAFIPLSLKDTMELITKLKIIVEKEVLKNWNENDLQFQL